MLLPLLVCVVVCAVCGPLPESVKTLNATWSCDSTGFGTQCRSTCSSGFIPDPTAPALTCEVVNGTGVWNLASLTGACQVDPGTFGPGKALPLSSGSTDAVMRHLMMTLARVLALTPSS
jgi:hypothetical protein